MINFVENKNRYKILTPSGFQNFDGVSKQRKKQLIFELDNGKNIIVSENHPFLIMGKIYNSSELKVGQDLQIKDKFCKIKAIKHLQSDVVYDILNAYNGNQYYGNDVLNHNCFLGSSYTLISAESIERLESLFTEPNNPKLKPEHTLQLHEDFPKTTINIYSAPQQNRAYIIGADPSEGGSSDYHAMTVWDITNAFKIELVASYKENNVNPNLFAYVLAKTGLLFNYAFIASERNGVSLATLNPLSTVYEYENIVCEGGDKYSIGIFSSGDRKFECVLNAKNIVEDPLREVLIYDGRIIKEMKVYEKRNRPGRAPTYAASSGNDDMMSATCWGLYVLHPDLIDSYYDVRQYGVDKLGNQIPLFICPFYQGSREEIKQRISLLDDRFKNISNKYEITMNNLEEQVREQQSNLLENFIEQQKKEQNERAYKPSNIYDTTPIQIRDQDTLEDNPLISNDQMFNDNDDVDEFVIGGF